MKSGRIWAHDRTRAHSKTHIHICASIYEKNVWNDDIISLFNDTILYNVCVRERERESARSLIRSTLFVRPFDMDCLCEIHHIIRFGSSQRIFFLLRSFIFPFIRWLFGSVCFLHVKWYFAAYAAAVTFILFCKMLWNINMNPRIFERERERNSLSEQECEVWDRMKKKSASYVYQCTAHSNHSRQNDLCYFHNLSEMDVLCALLQSNKRTLRSNLLPNGNTNIILAIRSHIDRKHN